MASRLKLETFDTSDDRTEAAEVRITASAMEEARLASYETGYSAGWEDAVSAQGSEHARIHAEVSRNLQTLSFTYHEARSHILRTLEPLLRDMVAKVLPDMARETLGPVVLDYLRPVAAQLANAPLTVTVNPASRQVVEQILINEGSLSFQIVEETLLGDGQVYLRFGDSEQQIDLDGVIRSIADAVDSFFRIEHEERAFG